MNGSDLIARRRHGALRPAGKVGWVKGVPQSDPLAAQVALLGDHGWEVVGGCSVG